MVTLVSGGEREMADFRLSRFACHLIAQDAGVHSRMFGVFHDAGYQGLYGGIAAEAIERRKKIPAKENLMDRMDTIELAAN